LQVKKYRLAEQCFLVQGAKAVRETLASDYRVRMLVATADFLNSSRAASAEEVYDVSEKELTSLGAFESNDAALAVVGMKAQHLNGVPKDDFTLVLEDIRDPGNLGTIIRTADWYGVKSIIASPETADLYNPKTINATMGSFLRVAVHYISLTEFIGRAALPSYGTFLEGKDVHTIDFGRAGLIVIGNESHGISAQVEKTITHRVTIPRRGGAESLNASVATAIVLDNVRRSS